MFSHVRTIDVTPYGLLHVVTCEECGGVVDNDYRDRHEATHQPEGGQA